MTDTATQWKHTTEELVKLYRDIERRSLSLPAFSIRPLLVYFWNVTKFYVFFLLDVFLIIPINSVILVRNAFSGRWRYRSFSWKYIRYAILWVWRGEYYIPSIHVRKITEYLLNIHFRRRLKLVRRQILLDNRLEDRPREELLSYIDQSLNTWPKLAAMGITFTYILPAIGFANGFLSKNEEYESSPLFSFGVMILIIYALPFIGTAFLVKRGLILGLSGSDVYYVGATPKAGSYIDERRILNSSGVRVKEFPVDIIIGSIALAPFLYTQITLVEESNAAIAGLVGGLLFSILLMAGVLWRRNRLNRM